ncbi:hypothetical protein FGRMN_1491 [Fusarium graminum]|nr:hypothetical protein FGRMN_1491 [Fusarium graminum]
MDSSFSFTPLWEENAIIHKPEKALDDLHAKVITAVLKEINLPEKDDHFNASKAIYGVNLAIKSVLADLSVENEVLDKIRATSAKLVPSGDPFQLIDATLNLWYIEAASVIHRHHDGRRQRSGPLQTRPWAEGYSNNFPMANLGFMSMLSGLQNWADPKHPKLQATCLISKATMAVLYITYTIGPHLKKFPWAKLCYMPVDEAYNLFFSVFTSVSGNPYNDGTIMTTPPAFEFNVTQEDVRISRCGQKLLVKVHGEESWHTVPAWHPYCKMPGSPWNNFIRNSEQPVFQAGSTELPEEPKIKYELPSSALPIALHFQSKYHAVRDEHEDNNDLARLPELSDDDRLRQLHRLSRLSGRKYAEDSPSDATAVSMVNILEEYLYYAPAVQKPRADASGNLTLPFMSTAIQAAQHFDDPVGVEDFFILNFEL